jgi:quercetin dioxygenase-like cupin family protein
MSNCVKAYAEDMREKIIALEKHILKIPQTETPVQHHFSPQIYMREMFIPKGTVLTGAIHKHEHLNILSQGELSVWTESGTKRLKASSVIKSMPGIKRAGYAHEDSVWITVHHNPTDEREPENLWNLFVTNTYEEFLEYVAANPQIEHKEGQ